MFNPISPKDIIQFQNEKKKEIEDENIKNGIIDFAQEQTEKVINECIKSTFKEYEDYKVNCIYPKQITIQRSNIESFSEVI